MFHSVRLGGGASEASIMKGFATMTVTIAGFKAVSLDESGNAALVKDLQSVSLIISKDDSELYEIPNDNDKLSLTVLDNDGNIVLRVCDIKRSCISTALTV